MSEREDDIEQQTIDLHFQQAMHNVKKQIGERLIPNNSCHNCEEELDKVDQLFCDLDCREDFQKRKRAESQRLY